MLYAFILGRVYTLSLAELLAVLQNDGIAFRVKTVAPEIALLETDTELNVRTLQDKIGGTIKIVKILDTLNRRQKDYPAQMMEGYLDYKILRDNYLAKDSGKIHFGVSIYLMDPESRVHFTEPKKIAQLIKKYLQARDVSVRFVMPEPPALNLPSVVVTNNSLLEKGAEFVLLLGRQNLSIGKTISVQDFEDYGRRDYQRPFRDPRMGMLPPKVAQMMVNLATVQKGQTILDPFCGSGTIIQDALLKGLLAVGSDLDQKAVEGAEKNLQWFRNRYNTPPGRYQVLKLDATADLEKEFPEGNFSAIITEGWLGPIYSAFPSQEEIKENFKNLLQVYVKSFGQFKKVLKKGGKIVISLPAYRLAKDKYVFFPTLDFIEKLGYLREDPLPADLIEKYKFLKVTERKTMVYDRNDQIVAREIVIIKLP